MELETTRVEQKPKKQAPRWIKILTSGFAALFIFTLGWGFGSGIITFSTGGQNGGLPDNLDYAGVEEVYDSLKRDYDGELDVEELQNGLKKGLAQAAGDDYTEYLTQEETEDFDAELAGSFTGIGAELSKKNDVITVVAPLAGYPAEAAGLRAGDVIVKIDGKNALDMTVTEAVKRIRGPKGTVVELTVARDGEELTLEIERDNISIPSVEYEVRDDGIGVMTISRFGSDTARLANEAAQAFAQEGVEGIVVDVRNNPGGLLDSAVDVADLWLDDGVILTERRGRNTIKTYQAQTGAPLAGIPTVVLINEGSASASEILAGALKDNGQADLLGEKSFGKGSVQKLDSLRTGGTLKVTIARWYTPDGKNIDKNGIKPDTSVERTDADYRNDRDPQLNAAIKQLQ